MATFTYTPSFNSALDDSPDIVAVKFGDGYEQSAYKGIHKYKKLFTLGWTNITQTEANAIVDFFKTNDSAITPFNWTPPDGTEGRFLCRKHKTTYVDSDIVNLTCTFEEVNW